MPIFLDIGLHGVHLSLDLSGVTSIDLVLAHLAVWNRAQEATLCLVLLLHLVAAQIIRCIELSWLGRHWNGPWLPRSERHSPLVGAGSR